MKRMIRITMAMTLAGVMLLASQITALASAPALEDIEYKGNGRVEMDFHGKVKYKNVSVTVKDESGKKYSVKKIRKDDDDISFTVKKIKAGKTYRVTVKGVKERGTDKYGKVSGRITTPKAAGGKGAVSDSSSAQKIATSHAGSTWGATGFYEIKAEKDRYGGTTVWEVDFKGTEGGVVYEYDYKIDPADGSILRYERELDD